MGRIRDPRGGADADPVRFSALGRGRTEQSDEGGKRIYFAGDTAYAPFFRDIPARIGTIDLALLPIGAYEPRWFMTAVHMNPEEAVQAHIDLQAAASIGMHFGTFQLTTEGIDEPVHALGRAMAARGVPAELFRVLPFGASLHVTDSRG